MRYLEQFAKKSRGKEKTEVLTARVPESIYYQFKTYCDDLGLSLSEAVNLLVYKELQGFESTSKPEVYTNVNKTNEDETSLHTNDDKVYTPVIKPEAKINTNVYKPKQIRRGSADRFTTKQWQINGELPCPICKQWASASNFARHAKQHGTNTYSIFTNEDYLKIIEEMIEFKTIK